MLFASTDLAARIERAECRLLQDAVAALRRREADASPLLCELGGGTACFYAEGSPLNKVAGLGFAGPIDEPELEAIEQAFSERGPSIQVEVSCLADPSVCAMLSRRGYTLEGFENVLGRPLLDEPEPTPREGLALSLIGPAEIETWVDLMVTGFATPDTQGVPSHESFDRGPIEQGMRHFASADGVISYLARHDGVLAGGGSMRRFEGVAQMCGAATLPAFRRRGIQTALLDRRLHDACAAGCDVAVVTTLPGSKSQQNVQRQGFELLYTRAVLVRGF